MREQPSQQDARQEAQQGAQQGGRKRDIWLGIGAGLLLHLIQIPLAAVTGFVSLVFIGVSQLLYIIPAIVIYGRRGQPGIVKGLAIAAALTFLLNATCAAILFAALAGANFH
jgi:hypothetical protein